MQVFKFRLFGHLEVHRGTQALNLRAGKVQELLCYLLLTRKRVHSREALAGLLWGDCSVAQSKKNLRQALWMLQVALNSAKEAERILHAGPDFVGIASKTQLWIDVMSFEERCAAVQQHQGTALDSTQLHALAQAVDLYRGDLLEGWYQDWCLVERERLQTLYLAALEKLMCHCEVRRQYHDAIDYGERILRLDRAREGTHQRMLRLLYVSGDRAGALRQYQRCVTALAEDLQVKPSKRTTELYEQIRADRVDPRQEPSAPGKLADRLLQGPVSMRGSRIPEFVDHLRRLQGLLSDFRRSVDLEIASLEQVLAAPRFGPAEASQPERPPLRSTIPDKRRRADAC